jgi:hypothetical protein
MADTTASTETAYSALEILTSLLEPAELTTSTESADPAATTTSTALAPTAEPTAATNPTGSRTRKPKPERDDQVIINCMKAWNSTYKKEAANLAEGQSDWPAEKAANQAYLREAPPLVGHKNICDFIACINFAAMTQVVSHRETELYLANARVALVALSLQPKPQATGAKAGGKPDANSAEDQGQ